MESLGRGGRAQKLGPAAFGLSLLADVPPPGAWQARPFREPSLQIRSVAAQAIATIWSGVEAIGWEGVIDGAPFVVERGRAGDHRFVHGAHPDHSGAPGDGTRAVHHLSPDANVLQCAASDPAEPSWWRVVLDSVLFTVALLRGYEALHAGAIATPDGVIAISAATGGGKSTLLAELLQRGLALMADDVLVLESRGTEAPLAHPAPPLMTVPAARTPILREGNPLETISSLGQEQWIAVPVHPEPFPLKALVVLDRRPGLKTSLEKIDDPLAPLMGSLMGFPSSPERQRTRFELASVLASKTELWRLSADLDTPPDVLTDALLAGSPRKSHRRRSIVRSRRVQPLSGSNQP
jgi:hypothetical protein